MASASCGFEFFSLIVLVCVFGGLEAIDRNQTIQLQDIVTSLNNYSRTFMFKAEGLNISPGCITALTLYGEGLDSLDMWALQMFDAMSKVQSGVLAGNLYNLGAYDECQSIKDVAADDIGDSIRTATLISGKYCLGAITFSDVGVLGETLSLMWAMCAPDACAADDLNAIMAAGDIPMVFTETSCHTPSQDPEITDGDVAVIVCFGVIALVMLLSSLYDVYLRHFEKKTLQPLLLAFSVVTNGEKLFAMRKSGGGGDQMECLHGIRSLSMMWVVLGHTFSNISIVAVTNVLGILEFFNDGWTMYVRGATVSVDSFFLMSGIVMIYVYLKSTKDKQCFNVLLYYLHRYLRLTPALAAVLVVHLTVLKHFGAGPFWPIMNGYAFDNCHKYWYSVLLYIQNYVNPYELCVGQSWYLSVDTQLFFISPIFLLPLKRWPKATLIVVLIAAMASISAGFAMAWIYKLHDINTIGTTPEAMEVYITKFYNATYTRAAPWLIGLIVGYFIYKVKTGQRKLILNNYFNLFMWACSLSVLAVVVFYDIAQDKYDRLAQSFYIALNRPAWSLALSWVIFACVTGHGGIVNVFLSLPIFQVIARLCYSMYLTHYTIILVMMLSIKQPLEFSNARVMYDFWSMFVLVLLISTIWTLAFESPVIIIEKYLLGGAARKPQMAAQAKPMDAFGNTCRHLDRGVDNNGYVHSEPTRNENVTKS